MFLWQINCLSINNCCCSGSPYRLTIFLEKPRTIKPAINKQAATNHIPDCEDCVRSLNAPITTVAPIPPSVDIEAIMAIPAAAALPRKKVPGMHQNEGKAAIKPIFANENRTTVINGLELKNGLKPTLMAARNMGKAVCQRRSRMRSELRPLIIKAPIARMLVMPVNTPIWELLVTPDS